MDTRISEKQKELAHLCRRFHVRRMELFGSAVQENKIGNVGDFDFLVEFEDLPPKEYANAYFGLREALETMLDHPVDIEVILQLFEQEKRKLRYKALCRR